MEVVTANFPFLTVLLVTLELLETTFKLFTLLLYLKVAELLEFTYDPILAFFEWYLVVLQPLLADSILSILF